MKFIQDDEKTLVEEESPGCQQQSRSKDPRHESQSKPPQHQDNKVIPLDIFQQQDQGEELILQLTYELQQLRLDYIKGIRQLSLDYDDLSAKKKLQTIQDLNVKQALIVAKDLSLSLEKENLPLRKRLPTTTASLKLATWNLAPYPCPPAPRPLRRESEISRVGTIHHLESDLHPLALGSLHWTRRFFQKGHGEPEELIPEYGGEHWPRNTTSLIKAVRACIFAHTEQLDSKNRVEPLVSLNDRRVIVLLILRADVVRDERDVKGKNALDYARLASDEFLVHVLESPKLPVFARFLLAISEGETEEVRVLVESDPHVYSLLLGRGMSGLAVAGGRAIEKVAAYTAYLEHSNQAAAGEDSVYAEVAVYYDIIKILLICEGVEAEYAVVDEILKQVEQGPFAEQNVELIELLHSVRKISLE